MKKILIISRKIKNLQSPVISVRILEILNNLKNKSLIQYCIIDECSVHVKKALEWADYVVFNKHSSDFAFNVANLAQQKKIKIIYDVDDLVLAWPKNHTLLYEQKKDDFVRFIEIADIVTVENDRLQDQMKHIRNDFITVKNSIDLNHRLKKEKQNLKGNSYCFSAYVDKLEKFSKSFIDTIKSFHARRKNMVFSFYGDNLLHIMSLPFVQHYPLVEYETYLLSLLKNNHLFAITPLGGSEDKKAEIFNMCKSPIKYLMYGYAEIPGIYSNVPPYNIYIENNVSGILVNNNKEEWLDAMLRLESDEQLRKKIIKNSYDDIYERFNTSEQAELYIEKVLV